MVVNMLLDAFEGQGFSAHGAAPLFLHGLLTPAVPEANPVLAVERETTDWDHAVDMRMMQKVLAPGMKHTQEADLGAKMFCVSRDFQQRGRTSVEQQVLDDLLVLES